METYIIKTPKEFRTFCARLKPIYSLDVETTSLGWLDLEIIGWSICDGKQACYVPLLEQGDNTDIKRRYKKELLMILDYYLSECRMVIFHNAAYDLMALQKEGIEV